MPHWHRSALKLPLTYDKCNPLLKKVLGSTLACKGGVKERSSNFPEASQANEASALDPEWATAGSKKLKALEMSRGTFRIHLTFTENIATTNGVPISSSYGTAVRIRRSAKYATMTGTAHTSHWLASREPEKNWTEPLMGWTSSSDPYASMAPLTFPNEASAISFCEKNRYSWYVHRQPPAMRNPIVRRYENNFHWSGKCRISTR